MDDMMTEEQVIAYLNFVDGPENLFLGHYGVEGQKWGRRRYQNEDGSLTAEGYEHYGIHNLSAVARDVNPDIGNDVAIRTQKKLYSMINAKEKKDKHTLLDETREYRKAKGDTQAAKYYTAEMKQIQNSAWEAKRFVDDYVHEQFGEYATAAEGESEKRNRIEKENRKARERGMREAEAKNRRDERERREKERQAEKERREDREHAIQMAKIQQKDAEKGREEMRKLQKKDADSARFWNGVSVLVASGVSIAGLVLSKKLKGN